MEKAELAARCSSVCIQFIRKSRENSLVYLFNLFDKALWITVLCQSVSVFQNLRLFKSQTGFSTKQIFSQVTKMDENWLLQEQLLFLSFYRWSLEGPQSPAVWNTETKEEAMDLWSKAGVRHHTKQLQGVIINFVFYIHSQANHRTRCEHKYLWNLKSVCMEISCPPALFHLLHIPQ